MAGIIRFLYWALLAYLVYAVIRFFRSLSRAAKPKNTSRPRISTGVMVKDEECNTYLPKEHALREVREGKEYFFCSQECRKKFLERLKSGDRPGSSVS